MQGSFSFSLPFYPFALISHRQAYLTEEEKEEVGSSVISSIDCTDCWSDSRVWCTCFYILFRDWAGLKELKEELKEKSLKDRSCSAERF